MSEWLTTTLGEVSEMITVGHVGSMASRYVDNGVPFLRSQNVRPGRLDLNRVKYISLDFHQELQKSQLAPNDVVIVRTGQPGAAALIPAGIGELNCADLVVVRPSESVDARFLCYVINATAGHFVSSHLVGAVQQHFNIGSARNLQILLPQLAQQRAIADVLSALDDKIAANDRVAASSHELAQAYAHRLTRDAPRSYLAEVADITMGSSPPGDTYNENDVGLPFFQGARDFGVRSPTPRVWCSRPVRTADVGATLVSVRAPVGRLNVAIETSCIGRGVAALTSTSGRPSVLFHSLNAAPGVWSPFVSEGTVFGSINKKQLERLPVPFIDSSVAEALEGTLAPLDARVAAALAENRTLGRLRDALLPGLMSGKTKVRDAEHAVDEAT